MKNNSLMAAVDGEVYKSNELIQKTRFSLSVSEQKFLLYIISKIDKQDEDFKYYTINIIDFCKLCGITASGRTYNEIKDMLQKLADKSFYMRVPGTSKERLLRWLSKVEIDTKKGNISVRIDDDMKPYLLQLKENFTQYELIYTLGFHSKYSIRLYELIKSVHYDERQTYEYTFALEDLRQKLGVETEYKAFKEFKRNVLSVAVNEINNNSDKTIEMQLIKKGREVVEVKFIISTKEIIERLQVRQRLEENITKGQLSLFSLESANDEK